MIHDVLPVGPLECNCSIVAGEDSKTAVVVDPGADIDAIEDLLERRGLAVEAILFTHAHLDHIGEAWRLRESTGAPTYLHPADTPLLQGLAQQAEWMGLPPPKITPIDHGLEDGQQLRLGGLDFQVLTTPGHSPGSVSFYLPAERTLLGGDTLFRSSVGRTDLFGGDAAQLMASIRLKLLPLGDDTRVLPGHGPATTIGEERRHNPFLRE